MKTKTYSTSLDKESFFTKLEKNNSSSFNSMGIQGNVKNNKGILECGWRASRKFSIEFVGDNKQINVRSHIGLVDFIFISIAVLSLIGMFYVFAIGEIKSGILCIIATIIISLSIMLSHILPWNRVDKVLKRDFSCVRIK